MLMFEPSYIGPLSRCATLRPDLRVGRADSRSARVCKRRAATHAPSSSSEVRTQSALGSPAVPQMHNTSSQTPAPDPAASPAWASLSTIPVSALGNDVAHVPRMRATERSDSDTSKPEEILSLCSTLDYFLHGQPVVDSGLIRAAPRHQTLFAEPTPYDPADQERHPFPFCVLP